MTEPDFEPAAHYDRVTPAWQFLLGDELHYGVFDQAATDLPSATAALTRRMADAARLSPGLRVLDVGCGTGAPACAIARDTGVEVLGISTSAVGVARAQERAADEGLADRVRFEVADALDNGQPDASVDRVWVLESSHLMPDRDRLLSECARVLRPGGRLVLCDIVRRREIPILEIRRRLPEFETLRAAFGAARMDPLTQYAERAERHGLVVEATEDLTDATFPTFAAWRANAEQHREDAGDLMGSESLQLFVDSTRILEGFWTEGLLGYGLLAASKP